MVVDITDSRKAVSVSKSYYLVEIGLHELDYLLPNDEVSRPEFLTQQNQY
jgi:hypothetical protein